MLKGLYYKWIIFIQLSETEKEPVKELWNSENMRRVVHLLFTKYGNTLF